MPSEGTSTRSPMTTQDPPRSEGNRTSALTAWLNREERRMLHARSDEPDGAPIARSAHCPRTPAVRRSRRGLAIAAGDGLGVRRPWPRTGGPITVVLPTWFGTLRRDVRGALHVDDMVGAVPMCRQALRTATSYRSLEHARIRHARESKRGGSTLGTRQAVVPGRSGRASFGRDIYGSSTVTVRIRSISEVCSFRRPRLSVDELDESAA